MRPDELLREIQHHADLSVQHARKAARAAQLLKATATIKKRV